MDVGARLLVAGACLEGGTRLAVVAAGAVGGFVESLAFGLLLDHLLPVGLGHAGLSDDAAPGARTAAASGAARRASTPAGASAAGAASPFGQAIAAMSPR